MQYPKREYHKEIQSILSSKDEMISNNKKQFIYAAEITRIFTKVRPIEEEDKILYLDASSVAGLDRNKYIAASLVRFNNLWQVNGVAMFFSDEINGKGKNTDEEDSNEENIRHTYEKIMKFTKNNPLMTFKNMDEYFVFWSKVFPNTPNIGEFAKDNPLKGAENLVLFAHEKRGTIILPDVGCWIKFPDNKLYNQEEASEYAVSLFFGSTPAPLCLISYLIENDMLPDIFLNSLRGKERGRQLVKENEWFIVRFFQPDLFIPTKGCS
ncbi:hypothetical protein FACS1894162_0020 [Bacteroidia bacterium]|nr:hypothetical protein FACS1894162_0020 [Bacteroidia bacterium]